MRDIADIQAQLDKYIDQMKKNEIEPAQFYKDVMGILAQMDVTNEDLKGVTPQMLGFIYGLIRNMHKQEA